MYKYAKKGERESEAEVRWSVVFLVDLIMSERYLFVQSDRCTSFLVINNYSLNVDLLGYLLLCKWLRRRPENNIILFYK